MRTMILAATIVMLTLTGTSRADPAEAPFVGLQMSPDASGVLATLNEGGPPDTSGAFFRSLGINGRSCATCHV